MLGVSKADVVEPGQKEVKYYYKLTNLDQYPDYILLAHGIPQPTYLILNEDEFSFYKFSRVSIYAVPRAQFQENQLQNMNTTILEQYFQTNPPVIPSNIILEGVYAQVMVSDPLDKVVVYLEIQSINPRYMEIKKTKIVYIYNDGTKAEKSCIDQNNTPPPPAKPLNYSDIIWYMILPLVALLITIFIIIRRRNS